MGDMNTGTIGYLQTVKNTVENKRLNSLSDENESTEFFKELKQNAFSSTSNNQEASSISKQTPLQSFEQETNIHVTLMKALFSNES